MHIYVATGFLWINRSISYYASCASQCWICFLQHLTYWIPSTPGLCTCVKLCLFASRFLHLAWELSIFLQCSPGIYNVRALSHMATTLCMGLGFGRLAGRNSVSFRTWPSSPSACLARRAVPTGFGVPLHPMSPGHCSGLVPLYPILSPFLGGWGGERIWHSLWLFAFWTVPPASNHQSTDKTEATAEHPAGPLFESPWNKDCI